MTNDTEIYYWDSSTIHQITDNDTNDTRPSLYGNQIAWSGSDGNDSEIYLATLTVTIPMFTDIIVNASANVEITWSSEEGDPYDVEYADGLYDEASLVWTPVTGIPGQASTTTWEDVNTPSTSGRYYRVKVEGTELYAHDTVGIVWKQVPAGRSLVSTPFIPYDSSLDSVIADQLTGSAFNKFFSDTIEKWDPVAANYERAWYDDSNWKDWETGGAPTFDWDADVGYWINIMVFNPAKDVCFVGKVSQEARSTAIAQGRNLCGSAYPAAVTLDDAELVDCGFTGSAIKFFSDNIEWWNSAIDNYDRVWHDTISWKNWDGTPATRTFVPCEGFWINVMVFNPPFTWAYPKPYMQPPNN